jgi:hypothetical protein
LFSENRIMIVRKRLSISTYSDVDADFCFLRDDDDSLRRDADKDIWESTELHLDVVYSSLWEKLRLECNLHPVNCTPYLYPQFTLGGFPLKKKYSVLLLDSNHFLLIRRILAICLCEYASMPQHSSRGHNFQRGFKAQCVMERRLYVLIVASDCVVIEMKSGKVYANY